MVRPLATVIRFINEQRLTDCATKGNLNLVSSPVVVATDLGWTSRNRNGVQSRDLGWRETVQSSVDVPSVESSNTLLLILLADGLFVESLVMRMLELRLLSAYQMILPISTYALEAFVVAGNFAVADELNLGLMGNGFKIGVEDASFGLASLVVAVAVID